MIDGLKAELPAYLAAAEDVSTEIEPCSRLVEVPLQ